MDGSLLQHHVAAFHLIPYIQHQELDFWAECIDVDILLHDEGESVEGDSMSHDFPFCDIII